jgi:mRNA-degrading endonuclease HigB of HigAB toxin-antitoxin module
MIVREIAVYCDTCRTQTRVALSLSEVYLQLKADLRNASILKNNRVVFNVCGNKYRIVVLMDYARLGMLIRFVGTHEQYDEIGDIEHI